MNGDGDGDDVAQERRIWFFLVQNNDFMEIGRADDEYADHYTVSELRDLIERHVENGTNDTIASILELYCSDGARLTEQECTLLCRSCQPLVHHLKKLYIRRAWNDLEASGIVRHMSLQSSTIDLFQMSASEEGVSVDGTTPMPMPMTMPALRDELPESLRTLELYNFAFTSEDCQFLGQMILNKERALDCVILNNCSFPHLADFLTLIAGFAKDKIPSDHCSFWWCLVKDGSILKHEGADDNPLDFGYIFGEFWQRHDEVVTCTDLHRGHLLHKAAHDLLNYFRPMQQAGLWSLLPPPPPPPSQNTDSASAIETRQPRERREWVKMLGHEAVKGRVDLLFHILLLNPVVCALQDRDCSVVTRLKTSRWTMTMEMEPHEPIPKKSQASKQANEWMTRKGVAHPRSRRWQPSI